MASSSASVASQMKPEDVQDSLTSRLLSGSWLTPDMQAAEMLGHVVDRAVQVVGGMGFCQELPIERYCRGAAADPRVTAWAGSVVVC